MRMHLSDHTAQKLTFAVQTTRENVREYTRFFNEEAKQTFISRLREQDWKTVYSVDEGEVNEQWNNFSSEFFRLFDECFPLKLKIRKKQTATKLKQDPQVVECKNRLDILLVLNNQDSRYKQLYKETKKEYDKLLCRLKAKHFQEEIKKSDNKNKTMWKICNQINGKHKIMLIILIITQITPSPN